MVVGSSCLAQKEIKTRENKVLAIFMVWEKKTISHYQYMILSARKAGQGVQHILRI
jgi:hypothetical protein